MTTERSLTSDWPCPDNAHRLAENTCVAIRTRFVVNVIIGGLACLLAAGLARELVTPRPLPRVPAPERANHVVTATAARSAALLPTTDYGAIVAKNRFSPDRSEATTSVRAAAGPKPLLYGVEVDGPRSRVYLEDPAVKGVFGYRTGDEPRSSPTSYRVLAEIRGFRLSATRRG